jgi:Domain of unknown function (DUF4388)
MRLELEVGREGAVALPPAEAESLGLAGGGPVDLLSARGAFALLVPARPDAPRSWFAGSLAALSVPEVVQSIYGTLKTGVLLLSFGGDRAARDAAPAELRRKSIHFRDGQVIFASSSDPADRLGPVLAARGLVTPDQLLRCARLVRSGRPLGQVLVDEGAVTPAQLYDGVVAQVREIVLGAFVETEGEFAFLEGRTDDANAVRLPERTRDLLLAGMRRLDQAEREQQASGVRPRASAEAGPTDRPPEAVGKRPEASIAAAPPPPAAGRGPFETYRRIIAHVFAALAAAETDALARLNGWLDALPTARRALFEGVRLDASGSLDAARVLANVAATGGESAAARARALEALEGFLAFALFEAKNRLPRPAAEKLVREVGRMQMGKA